MRVIVAIMMMLAAGVASAAGDHELLAAEQELKIARDHLSAAGTEYEGHRRAAIRLIDQALHEIRQGIKTSRGQADRPPQPRKGKGTEAPDESPADD